MSDDEGVADEDDDEGGDDEEEEREPHHQHPDSRLPPHPARLMACRM